MSNVIVLAQQLTPEIPAGAWLIVLGIVVLMIAGWWRLFEKAGQAGILALIPLVNVIVYVMISGKPLWWIILMLIPVVNLFIVFMIHLGVSENFGQGVGFAFGLFFLQPIFVLLLGFGDYQYYGQKSKFA